MSKKKNNKKSKQTTGNANQTPQKTPKPPPKVVKDWDEYFNRGDLEDWQRLMRDLGFTEDFPSKSKCRKALEKVWVNIEDFLDAVRESKPPVRFKNEHQLAAYTKKTGKIYPRDMVEKGSPLSKLLAHIRNPKRGRS